MTTSASTTSVPSIPRLTPFNFTEWHLACTEAAKQCLPTNGPLGGLGLLLPKDAYADLNKGEPYTLATKPPSVSNTDTAHRQKIFDREQQALGSLTRAVFESIPIPTQQSAPGYNHTYGNSFITLPDMIEHVSAKYGTYSAQAYHQARAVLLRPYDGGDLDAFLAQQVKAHHACERTGNAVNELEKVNSLISALGPPFQFTIASFEETCSSLNDRTWNALATRIRQAATRVLANAPVKAPSTGSYYGAASATEAPATKADIIAALRDFAEANAIRRTATGRDTGPRGSDPNPGTGAGTGPQPKSYCWTHGLCGHTSTTCRYPRPGHDRRATESNKHGGREGRWVYPARGRSRP